MDTIRGARVAGWVLVLGSLFVSGGVQATEAAGNPLTLSSDFRLRLESDFDSKDAAGVAREDRSRARVRARLKLEYARDPYSLGLRLRSGAEDSQQSPHITVLDFDGNDTGDAAFDFDQWYLKVRRQRLWAWVGRNGFPFWKQNELLWDDDVTPAGIALGYGGSALTFTAGYFSLPAGMQAFAGNLGAGQLVYTHTASDVQWVAAAGVYALDAEPADPDAALFLAGNGLRDYTIWHVGLQARLPLAGRPLTLGADLMHNSEDYATAEPDRDEDSGYVLATTYGQTKSRGDWLAGYSYARIETLAVHSSFAQDDWVRWGNATQTRGSNLKGHELRFGYALTGNINLLVRLYFVESVTTVEDGSRARLDLNVTL